MKTDQKVIEKSNGVEAKTANTKTNKTNVLQSKAPMDAVQTKAEVKDQVKEKLPLNLESTLEVLENLQSRMRQRNRLIHTIEDLEKFEIDIQKEGDELGGNHFQGCGLKIADDNRNEFFTNNPVVIAAVSNYIKDMCTARLAEIEATIVLP